MKITVNGKELPISAPYGNIDPWHPTPHQGTDIAIVEGTELYSPTDGIVESVVDYGNVKLGKAIVIRTEEGEKLIYGHLSDNSFLTEGQTVRAGDFVGLSGNTGRSSGPHLHVGLKDNSGQFINPEKYVGEEMFVSTPNLSPDVQLANNLGDMFQMAMDQYTNSLAEMKFQTLNLIMHYF